MNRMRPFAIAASLALLAQVSPPPARAADVDAKGTEDFETVKLGKRLSVGFGMVRVSKDEPAEALPLDGRVIERQGGVTRFLLDEASGAAFGYRLDVSALSTHVFALRVDIRPLVPSDEKDLKRLAVCATCPAPRLMGSGPTRFPPTQIVKDGDTMVIDLLIRPDTGEKIVDVLKFSTEPVTREIFRALRLQLDGAWRHVIRAGDLTVRGSLDGAVVEYEKAVQLNPADPDAWHGLSVLRHRRGSYGKAIAGYRQALKIRPGWALARRNLATAHLDRADLPQAFEEYRRAERSAPGTLESKDESCVKAQDAAMQHYLLAKVYAAVGNTEAALESLKNAKAAGFTDLERIHEDPEFKPLLRDPRLAALARDSRS